MAYTPHVVVKPEKIVGIAAGLIEPQLTLAKLVTREGYEKLKGAGNDTLVYTVPGILPYRRKNFRDPRIDPLHYDVYKEGKTTITFGGYIYSGVKITDEQAQFDLNGWAALLSPQAQAVAAGINQSAADLITSAPYEVNLTGVGSDADHGFRRAFNEARRVLNRFGVPQVGRIAIVGTDVENAMLNEKDLTLAQYVGDVRADTALGEAIIGRMSGFTIVSDSSIDAADMYFMVPSGFVQLLGTPLVPQSVPFGATIRQDGIALRWMRDYDMDFRTDRSVVDSWEGSNIVKDMFLPKHVLVPETNTTYPAFDPNTLNQFFVRGIKGTLDGEPEDSVYPTGAGKADLIAATEISAAETRRWGAV